METTPRDSLRVLVVEDDPLVREVLVELAGEEFSTVLQAENGMEALEMVVSAAPDLVLLDLAMPHMDGFETCRRLRMIDGMGDVPILVLTAHRAEPEVHAAFEAGATDYLVKPFTNGQLRARLRTHALSHMRLGGEGASAAAGASHGVEQRRRAAVLDQPEHVAQPA